MPVVPFMSIDASKTDPTSPRAAESKGGFGALARRITGRTTDLIAIGLVLVGGLTMGRQLVQWWNAPAEMPILQGEDATGGLLADPGAAVRLRFGDAPLAMTRETLAGNREAAMARLIAGCREAAENAGPPRDAPDAGEFALLAATEHAAAVVEKPAAEKAVAKESPAEKPLAEEPGGWGVFRLEDRLSMIVATKVFPSAEGSEGPAWRRVVAFGFALPLDTDQWALYSFAEATLRSGQAADFPEIELPPGARRSLALQDQGGGGMIGFGGAGDPAAWRKHFEEALGAGGWVLAGPWRTGGDSDSATFVPRDRSKGGSIGVHVSGDPKTERSGLIVLVRGPSAANVVHQGSSQ